ncbi:MAG: hypothetical protein NT107_12695 [Planctomycetota bacterium]|nr:hypothetical protein [Planctomycetota bacterium]
MLVPHRIELREGWTLWEEKEKEGCEYGRTYISGPELFFVLRRIVLQWGLDSS